MADNSTPTTDSELTNSSLSKVISPNSSKRVVLNVGGKRYETVVSNFLKYPQSTLGLMFSPENAHLNPPDERGEYFIDRNGRLFEYILDFYRTGELHIPPTVSVDAIRDEIAFFQLPITPENIPSGLPLGIRLRAISLQNALNSEPVAPAMKKITDCLECALLDAAAHGCWVCTIDIMKNSAFIRANRGHVMHADSINPNVEFNKPTGKWHHNLVDPEVAAFLSNPYNRRILDAFLQREQLRYKLKQDRSFFVLKIYLFEMHSNSHDNSDSDGL